MAKNYLVIRTIENSSTGKTDIATVFWGVDSKINKSKVETIASDYANSFVFENSFRRVEFDCIEVNEQGERTIFKNLVLDNPIFGKVVDMDIREKVINDINKDSVQ